MDKMEVMQLYEYLGNDLRIVFRSGEPYWALKDVCQILGIQNNRDVAKRLDDDDLTYIKSTSGGQTREMIFVNEYGVWDVVIRSDKPEARAFRRWLTHEVIPSIRKTGGYGLGKQKLAVAYANAQIKRAREYRCLAEMYGKDEPEYKLFLTKAAEMLR